MPYRATKEKPRILSSTIMLPTIFYSTGFSEISDQEIEAYLQLPPSSLASPRLIWVNPDEEVLKVEQVRTLIYQAAFGRDTTESLVIGIHNLDRASVVIQN